LDRDAHPLADAVTSLAVVGAGWAGLAAAVHARAAGHAVTLFETARVAGGRARTVPHLGLELDNGQHILIGAYRETLALMRRVGADPDRLLDRRPLALVDPHGHGLRLGRGAAVPAFVRGVLALRAWPLADRLALLRAALRWRLAGFRAAPHETVADLVRRLPLRVRESLIEPLCVAALNTPGAARCRLACRARCHGLPGPPGASPRADRCGLARRRRAL
jgi:predicted NAD/FAD-binding protein